MACKWKLGASQQKQGPDPSSATPEPQQGWFYYDPFGRLQGPFTVEALRSFRWHLPMDLLVWYKEEPKKYLGQRQHHQHGKNEQSAVGHPAAVSEAASYKASPQQQQQQQQQPQFQGDSQEQEPEAIRLKSMDNGDGLASIKRTDSIAAEGWNPLASPDCTAAVGYGAAESSALSPLQHLHTAGEERSSSASALSARGEPAQAVAPTDGQNCAGVDAADAGAQEGDREGSGFAVELAELLGDGVLLTDWRTSLGQPDCSSGPPRAPPAPVWEQWLLYGVHTQDAIGSEELQQQVEQQQQEQEGAGDVSDYASAALAGLPPDDEAAVLARLAEASGKSLQELLDFSYANSSSCKGTVDPDAFASAAEYNPRRRRLQVAGAEDNMPGSLYRELSSWCNPEQLEQSLQAAASRRGKPLPASVWRQLKERKEEHKKRARTAALLS
eukprot:CAMPEP_0202373108 /NCGR_PEP_ID=MMETSP1127-20130417/4182_1 /ASSEMBLY_ACC=CAM_ASM_000462 /TAXON_ID=3047 /ORGANISM="Dunaliella tertiolecta, Strain CCMP1320" /LENGTH=440 /DNA_ID=CAMNT_0048969869 /DNA_START=283 /DNA_END=1606 /DNA_ORIENTATION=-